MLRKILLSAGAVLLLIPQSSRADELTSSQKIAVMMGYQPEDAKKSRIAAALIFARFFNTLAAPVRNEQKFKEGMLVLSVLFFLGISKIDSVLRQTPSGGVSGTYFFGSIAFFFYLLAKIKAPTRLVSRCEDVFAYWVFTRNSGSKAVKKCLSNLLKDGLAEECAEAAWSKYSSNTSHPALRKMLSAASIMRALYQWQTVTNLLTDIKKECKEKGMQSGLVHGHVPSDTSYVCLKNTNEPLFKVLCSLSQRGVVHSGYAADLLGISCSVTNPLGCIKTDDLVSGVGKGLCLFSEQIFIPCATVEKLSEGLQERLFDLVEYNRQFFI